MYLLIVFHHQISSNRAVELVLAQLIVRIFPSTAVCTEKPVDIFVQGVLFLLNPMKVSIFFFFKLHLRRNASIPIPVNTCVKSQIVFVIG